MTRVNAEGCVAGLSVEGSIDHDASSFPPGRTGALRPPYAAGTYSHYGLAFALGPGSPIGRRSGHPFFMASHLPFVWIRPSWLDGGTLRRPPNSWIGARRPTVLIHGRLSARENKPTDKDGWPRSSLWPRSSVHYWETNPTQRMDGPMFPMF